MFCESTVKRSRSTPESASAQPSATSPDSTEVWNSKVTFEITGVMSGSPPGGAAHVHDAVHGPEEQALTSLPSHCSAPSRTLLPQMLGGKTLRLKLPCAPP